LSNNAFLLQPEVGVQGWGSDLLANSGGESIKSRIWFRHKVN